MFVVLLTLAAFGAPLADSAYATEDDLPVPTSATETSEQSSVEQTTSQVPDPTQTEQSQGEVDEPSPSPVPADTVDSPTVPAHDAAPVDSVVVQAKATEPPSTSEPAAPDPADSAPMDAPTPTPSVPSLIFSPAERPLCVPADGQPEIVASGGYLEYDCTHEIDLVGEHLLPSNVQLDWTIGVSVAAGWSAQLRPPSSDADAQPSWTWPDSETVEFRHLSRVDDPSLLDAAVPFVTTQRIAFGLRVHRAVCATNPSETRLYVSVVATVPGDGIATVTQATAQPEPFVIDPALAADDERAPTVSILDLSIAPASFSLSDQVTRGTLTILVENPTVQCRDWAVSIEVHAFVGVDGSAATVLRVVGDLTGAPQAGYEAVSSQEGNSLAAPLVVSVVHAGAEPGSYTQTIGLDLTIPGQASTGTYRAQTTAAVEPI